MSKTVQRLLLEKGFGVWSVGPEDSVYRAIELMAEKSIGAALVLENEVLVGIISERDYARKVILKDRSSKATPVKDIMTSPVITISPDATIEHCMKVMTGRRIRHLPVVSDTGNVTGIISIGDVLKAVIVQSGQTIDQLERYIMGH